VTREDVVLAVAKAIALSEHPQMRWGEWDAGAQQSFRRDARAVIRTLEDLKVLTHIES
jgi:hypothetical protein